LHKITLEIAVSEPEAPDRRSDGVLDRSELDRVAAHERRDFVLSLPYPVHERDIQGNDEKAIRRETFFPTRH
jgi:hypothetical protein